jgi:FAD/FMN-containing dehydrogenase/Fe-S oxidoreductase
MLWGDEERRLEGLRRTSARAAIGSSAAESTAKPEPRSTQWRSLEQELRREVDGEVRFDPGSRALYNCDASNYRHFPIGVVIPRTTDAVEAALAVCRRHQAPLLSRGAGTGLSGQTCNEAVVLDYSKYLNRILEIDPERRLARVQPGVVLDHLRARAAAFDLTYAPDPATHTHNTFGGMIGNNSCGIHSIMAGRTADNIQELEVLTYDGLRLRVGETDPERLERIIAEGGRRGDIYARMKRLRDRYADLIRARYHDIPRRVSGYNLDDLLPEKGFHVARALVGSEGTLVAVLEATVRLVYSWPGRALVLLGYPDVYAAADHVPEIMAHGPVGLEGLDDKLIGFNERKDMNLKKLRLLPEGGGWLLVEMGGHDKAEAGEKARRLVEDLKNADHPPNIKVFTDEEEAEKIWAIRESGLGATANVPGEPLAWPGWEDAAVPPEKVGPYLREFRQLMDEFDLDAALYGHFGQGCIHCRITFDLLSHEGILRYRAFAERAAELVARYGGSFTGEHGDGQSKSVFLDKLYGPELLEAFRELKTIWDPDGKMNPGNLVDPRQPEADLRLGTDYAPWHAETFFKFPDDGGSFARATLRCVGVGKCRRPEAVFMCPSYLVTRDEMHTTRGRAHALFEMFRGDFIRDGWRSEAVRETLELCLACKACKSECPVNVDMATYKMEFLHHHYRGRLRPRHHYALGFMGYTAELGNRLPGLVNFFTQTRGIAGLVKRLIDTAPERPLPRFADRTFVDWFRDYRQPVGEDAPPVLLYPDVFNNSFDPEILKAATRVLGHLNRRVLLPETLPPAALPLMHFGFLGLAGRRLRKTIALLTPYARAGIPIVLLEPSVAAMLRDDLPKIWPHDHDLMRIVKLCMMLSEFIVKEEIDLPRIEGRAILHNHCNQKAVLDPSAVHRVLRRMEVEVEEPQSGCCGMAGSFGYVREHYALSLQLAEQQLLPAVRRAAPETFILAEAFSCRSQIRDGTEREPLHTVQLIERAFDSRANPARVASRGGYHVS